MHGNVCTDVVDWLSATNQQKTGKPNPIMHGGSVTNLIPPELMGYFVSFPGETLSSLGTGRF